MKQQTQHYHEKKKVKRNANPGKRNPIITSQHFVFLSINLQNKNKNNNTTILSDIHGIKKQKALWIIHFPLYQILSLWDGGALQQTHVRLFPLSSTNRFTIQLVSTNYWGLKVEIVKSLTGYYHYEIKTWSRRNAFC